MNPPTLNVVHGGITIEYSEADNQWVFELRGRERRVESLIKAKEFIDKPNPVDKPESTFKPVICWHGRWNEGWQQATVTSIADVQYGTQKVWATIRETRQAEDMTTLERQLLKNFVNEVTSLLHNLAAASYDAVSKECLERVSAARDALLTELNRTTNEHDH